MIKAQSAAHIVLCVEADSTVGMGHAVRCAGLINEISLTHRLSVAGGGPILKDIFPNARHIDLESWVEPAWVKAESLGADVVIADLPYESARDWSRMREGGKTLIVVDDHGGSVDADVVINGNVLPEYHRYEPTTIPRRLLTGPKYAFVRPQFPNTPWRPCSVRRVTIVVGSGRAAREWLAGLLENFRISEIDEVHVVVGRAFDGLVELQKGCELARFTLHFDIGAAQLSCLLSGSSVALITAGMALYETVAAGIPTVAYPQVPDLVPEAKWFADRGGCIDLGANGCSPALASRAIRELLDPAMARKMSTRQTELIDGQGLRRSARIVEEYMTPLAKPSRRYLKNVAEKQVG